MRIVIVGAGVVGLRVVDVLVNRRHDVVVVDRDRDICDQVYAEHGVVAVHGSGTDLHVLEGAGTTRADVFITLTHSDSDNVTAALLAKSLGVKQIISRMRDPSYEESYRGAGVTHLVRVTDVLTNQIVAQVEHPQIVELVGVGDDRIRIFSVEIDEGAPAAGRRVADIASEPGFPAECLFLGAFRQGGVELEITRGATILSGGDTLLIVAPEEAIDSVIALVKGRSSAAS